MTETAAQLIRAFTSLSADERYSVLIELARLSQSDAPMTDEDFSRAGQEIFAMYDEEETQLGESKER
jgi:hypothetical protein